MEVFKIKTKNITILITILIILFLITTIVTINITKNNTNEKINKNKEKNNINENNKNTQEFQNNNEKVTIKIQKLNNNYVCNTPYIKHENSCCIDINNNKICDKDENEKNKNQDSYYVIEGCGDGICTVDEKNNCCADCGCKEGSICTIDNECIKINNNNNQNTENNNNQDNDQNNEEVKINFSTIFKDPYKLYEFKNKTENNDTLNFTLSNNGLLNFNSTIFYENLSTTDYIIAVLDSVKLTMGSYDDPTIVNEGLGDDLEVVIPNNINEMMMYVQAYTPNEEVQKVVYPLGRPKEVYAEELSSSTFVENMPIFAIQKDYLNDYIAFTILISEADKKTVLQKINYDTEYNKIKQLFSGKNDLLVEESIRLDKNNNYGIGTHTINEYGIEIKYTVKEVKVPYDIPIKVKLKKIDVIYSRDEPEGENPAEPVLWYRVADGFVADEYGVSTEYDTRQSFGGLELPPLGSGPASDYPTEKEFNNFVLFDTDSIGPFLTIELDLYDRDSKCKSLKDHLVYNCANTDKMEEIQQTQINYILDDPRLLQNPEETKTFTIKKDGFEIEITRGKFV